MGEGEMWIFVPGWNLNGTWKGVTQESWRLNAGDAGPGWRWDANLCILIELRWYTDGVYTSILGFGFWWDRTWMEVRCTFMKPGWVWDDAWIGVKCIFWDWDGGDVSPGRRWEASMWTWIEVRLDMEGEETWILESKWSWDADHETWMGWDGTRI